MASIHRMKSYHNIYRVLHHGVNGYCAGVPEPCLVTALCESLTKSGHDLTLSDIFQVHEVIF